MSPSTAPRDAGHGSDLGYVDWLTGIRNELKTLGVDARVLEYVRAEIEKRSDTGVAVASTVGGGQAGATADLAAPISEDVDA
jgi:hypothetical protein